MAVERDNPIERLAAMRQRDADFTRQISQMYAARRGALQRRAGGLSGGAGAAPATGDLQAYAQQRMAALGMGGTDNWNALYSLWQKESGWNPNAVNKSSGAFGIAQILPSAHPDVPRNLTGQQQIDWGLNYIKQRYGSPSGAWAHSQQTDWY